MDWYIAKFLSLFPFTEMGCGIWRNLHTSYYLLNLLSASVSLSCSTCTFFFFSSQLGLPGVKLIPDHLFSCSCQLLILFLPLFFYSYFWKLSGRLVALVTVTNCFKVIYNICVSITCIIIGITKHCTSIKINRAVHPYVLEACLQHWFLGVLFSFIVGVEDKF